MANNRSGISHPALNAAGGSALWTSIDNIYQLLSDQDLGRWVDFTALANSAKVTVTHSFGVSFDDLKVVVYTGTYPNLTQVQTFTVAATTGFEKTKIDVTAPASGGPFSGYVLVVHNAAMQERVLTTAQRLALASPTSGMKVYDSDLGKVVYYNGTAWKVPADLDTAETLSNKTLAAPVFNTFSVFNQTSTPVTAAAGTVRVYAKADNKLYKMDSTGAEASIGSGSGSGGVNYVVDWYDGTKPITAMNSTTANGNILVANIAAPNNYSTWYADGTSAAPVNAGSFVTGATYIITTVGTTNFVAVGAASNTVGVVFTATGAGSGTGTVIISAAFSSSNTSLRGSSNYLTQLSGASTSGATFVQTPAFNVDAFDLGKPVTISFDLTGVTTADDWDVVVARYTTSGTLATYAELISVAGTASSITGTAGAQLPTGTTQFKGFFIPSSTATDVYALRFRRRTGSTQIRIDSLTVGPQSLAQGAIVTAWQSFTPVFTGLGGGSGTTSIAVWRRLGDSMLIRLTQTSMTGSGSSSVQVDIPNSLTIDSTKAASLAGNFTYFNVFGAGAAGNGTTRYACTVEGGTASTRVLLRTADNITKNQIQGSDLSTAGYFAFEAMIPISQWSSGTTTLADRAVEEYASNSGAEGTAANTQYSNSSYFVNGPNGSLVPSVNSTTANGATEYLCRFQTAILPTDSILLEVQQIGTGAWLPVYAGVSGVGMVPYQRQATSYYGIGFSRVSGSSTDIYVIFGNYGARPGGAGAAFSSVGDTWSNFTAYRWRLRKVQSGAAVGFPVSARNIVGDTSGSVVPTGMIGEELISTSGSAVALTNNTFATIASITLTAGTWDISAFGTWQNTATQATGNQTMNMAISTAPASSTGATAGLNYAELCGISAKSGYAGVTLSIPPNRVIVSSNTQRFLCIRFFADAAGSGNQAIGTIRATRIA